MHAKCDACNFRKQQLEHGYWHVLAAQHRQDHMRRPAPGSHMNKRLMWPSSSIRQALAARREQNHRTTSLPCTANRPRHAAPLAPPPARVPSPARLSSPYHRRGMWLGLQPHAACGLCHIEHILMLSCIHNCTGGLLHAPGVSQRKCSQACTVQN
jgi:hypothetical protein